MWLVLQIFEQDLRIEKDLRNEKISYKIREHTLARVPFLLVAGEREKEAGTLSVRTREGKDLGSMAVQDVIAMIRRLIDSKSQEISNS